MPSKCSAVNYLGARVGLWQQFPLRGSSQRAGGSLSMRTSAQSQSTPNGESPTQQLQCKGTSLCLYAPQPGSSLTSPEGDERQKEAKPRWGEGVRTSSDGDWDRQATIPVYGTQKSDPKGLLMVF